MLAIFSLRLACGLALLLPILPPDLVNPRFYRAHFWTILGLLVVPGVMPPADAPMHWWLLLGTSVLAAFGGSLAWSLERAPSGRLLVWLTTGLTLATLVDASAGPIKAAWVHSV